MADPYVGSELELFANAHNWKSYFTAMIRAHLGANVLEVGAGLGGTTATLVRNFQGQWLCLEPDEALAGRISTSVATGTLPSSCTVSTGTLDSLPSDAKFDTILYVDVLEHIEDDASEAHRAASRLSAGGKLVILSPAYQWLYSPFDEAIGHYRRYTKRSLLKAIPKALSLVQLDYLDAVGLLASAGNRLVTRRALPTPAQIAFWDRILVPASRLMDPLVLHSFGKSLLGVWQLSAVGGSSPQRA